MLEFGKTVLKEKLFLTILKLTKNNVKKICLIGLQYITCAYAIRLCLKQIREFFFQFGTIITNALFWCRYNISTCTQDFHRTKKKFAILLQVVILIRNNFPCTTFSKRTDGICPVHNEHSRSWMERAYIFKYFFVCLRV